MTEFNDSRLFPGIFSVMDFLMSGCMTTVLRLIDRYVLSNRCLSFAGGAVNTAIIKKTTAAADKAISDIRRTFVAGVTLVRLVLWLYRTSDDFSFVF